MSVLVSRWGARQPGPGTIVQAGHPLSQGLVASYLCAEGGGTIVTDGSGFANHGTITGASWVAGQSGKALSFNGTSNYVDCGTKTSLDCPNNASVSFWVRFASLSTADNTWRGVVAKRSALGDCNYGFNYNSGISNDKFQVFYTNPTNSYNITSIVLSTYLTAGRWYHFVGTFVKSGGNTILSLYLDGIVRASTNSAGNVLANTTNLYLGQSNSGGEFLSGYLQNVRIYNRALSSSEVMSLYVDPYGNYTPRRVPVSVAAVAATKRAQSCLLGVGA